MDASTVEHCGVLLERYVRLPWAFGSDRLVSRGHLPPKCIQPAFVTSGKFQQNLHVSLGLVWMSHFLSQTMAYGWTERKKEIPPEENE
jgi:hypothetical protein